MSIDQFAARHRWDRAFFAAFVAIGWLVVLAGFAGSVRQRMEGHADYPAPTILVFHVIVFVGWMLLLTLQVALVGAGRADIHRRLGIAGVVLLPLVILTGIGAEVFSQRFYTPKYPENANFFIVALVEMGIFAVCASMAFVLRRDPPSHKRLMLLATSLLLAAGFNRWWGDAMFDAMGDGFWGMLIRTFAGPDLLIFLAIAFDLLTRHQVHRVYLIAVPLIIVAQFSASMIYHSPAWPPVARTMVGL